MKKIKKLIPTRIKSFITMILYILFCVRARVLHTPPVVKSFNETVANIVENRMSVSRFGDGEFMWILKKNNVGSFEIPSDKLASALAETLSSDSANLMVCIPDVFSGLGRCNRKAKKYWRSLLWKYGMSWLNILDKRKVYFDAFLTRPYMDYADKSGAKTRFECLKKIWQGRDVILIEGTKSKFGVGNDLLSNAKSVRRILVPAENAFESYELIKESAIKESRNQRNELFLLSVGPTATILAADLADLGYQAIDAGHIDIEYSWFLMGAQQKVPVDGKYVNELPDEQKVSNVILNSRAEEVYNREIVNIIKSEQI